MDEMTDVAREVKELDGAGAAAQPAGAGASGAARRRSIPRPREARLAELLGGAHERDRPRISTISRPLPSCAEDQALVVTVDGFEGPLDLLLTLARNQKVDIAKISILKLADQYLEFIESAKKLNLELAADYLVMAAWLAYLKSRLILPQEKAPEGEPTADEMATRLRWRLQRLDAMRAAATRLMGRERLDRDVFGRGDPGTRQCHQAAHLQGHALRPADRLCHRPGAQAGRQGLSPGHGAGAADRGGAGAAGTDAGQDCGLERADAAVAASNGRAAPAAARPWPPPCWPAWNWPATARSSCSRWRPLTRFMCGTGRKNGAAA